MSKKAKKNSSFWKKIKSRQQDLLSRRPHRSFKMTRRRDYSVKLPMPGYISFTASVFSILKSAKNTFILLFIIGCGLIIWSGSFMGQDRYIEMIGSLSEAVQGVFGDTLSSTGEVVGVMMSIFFGGVNKDEMQSSYLILVILLVWLNTVWLVRNIKAGKKVALRQGLYNSGAPIVSTFLVVVVGLIQIIPSALAIGLYFLAQQTGVMDNGAVAMGASIATLGIIIMSLYWITSTFIALIIVTLPNMYPMNAIRLAGDLVSGIRLRILYRFLWLVFVIGFSWSIILGLSVSLDILLRGWLDWFVNVPFIPVVVIVLSIASLIFSCTYIYMLYMTLVEARREGES